MSKQVTLRADACPVQVVIVCSCGARVASGRPDTAWRLAARHALLHGTEGTRALDRANGYARYHARRLASRGNPAAGQ